MYRSIMTAIILGGFEWIFLLYGIYYLICSKRLAILWSPKRVNSCDHDSFMRGSTKSSGTVVTISANPLKVKTSRALVALDSI